MYIVKHAQDLKGRCGETSWVEHKVWIKGPQDKG